MIGWLNNISGIKVSSIQVTREQIDARISDYVCNECGSQFLTDSQKAEERIVTAHESECGLCGVTKSVTHIRAYNYLNYKT